MCQDAAFRQALTSNFCVKWIDADLHRDAAAQRDIYSLPTFEIEGRRIVGYDGKQALWDQLTRPETSSWEPAVSDDVLQHSPDPDVQTQAEVETNSALPLPPLERPTRNLESELMGDKVQHLIEPPVSASVPDIDSAPKEQPSASISKSSKPAESKSSRPSLWSRLRGTVVRAAPLALTALELAGLLGGTAATGGLGSIVFARLWRIWSRRRRRQRTPSETSQQGMSDEITKEDEQRVPTRAPFPRQLDEASELLELRQSEGRVAVLDALRGMFLDDELTKLIATGSEEQVAVAQLLRTNIDSRVDDVAPLSTTVN
ncbi:MAG: hypothetical protein R3C02_08970 [Planctomycetaceae bacterium]